MSNLNKETLYRIQADARAIPEDAGPVKTGYMRVGYQLGAIHEAEMAQPIIDLLEKMVAEFTGAAEMSDKEYDKELIKKSKIALAKYKEVSNE